MARAFLFVLDSFGIGGAPDAGSYGQVNGSDLGANTFLHIAQACALGEADDRATGNGTLKLPNLASLGLAHAAHGACGEVPTGFDLSSQSQALAAHAVEQSKGKDTPSGHWEIAGRPVPFDWGYFPRSEPTFPSDLLAAIYDEAGLAGSLGNEHASGTEIISRLGAQHVKTGQPIFYTSNDSVFQIAAHEDPDIFGLDRLLDLCQTVFRHTSKLNVGRVIARPFVGDAEMGFDRTGNRRDFAIAPPEDTLLDRAKAAGRQVIAVGKIADIYAQSGVTDVRKASGNEALTDTTLKAMDDAQDGDLVFTNFVDFDMLYGHRRDVSGYAAALEAFDARLPELMAKLRDDDLMVLTADHGCDPSWHGTDHTREQVPVLAYRPGIRGGFIGQRDSFADIGASVAQHLGLPTGPHGRSFL
ncbi:MAG: phosphopentomutase [Pseudomonadota bacterium]